MDSKIKRDGDAIFCFHQPSKEFSARCYRTTKNKINKRNAGATFFSPERGARATSLQTTLEKLLPARSTTRPENRLLLCSVSNNHTDSNHRGLPPPPPPPPPPTFPHFNIAPPPKKERTKKKESPAFSTHYDPISLYTGPCRPVSSVKHPQPPLLLFFFLFVCFTVIISLAQKRVGVLAAAQKSERGREKREVTWELS